MQVLKQCITCLAFVGLKGNHLGIIFIDKPKFRVANSDHPKPYIHSIIFFQNLTTYYSQKFVNIIWEILPFNTFSKLKAKVPRCHFVN